MTTLRNQTSFVQKNLCFILDVSELPNNPHIILFYAKNNSFVGSPHAVIRLTRREDEQQSMRQTPHTLSTIAANGNVGETMRMIVSLKFPWKFLSQFHFIFMTTARESNVIKSFCFCLFLRFVFYNIIHWMGPIPLRPHGEAVCHQPHSQSRSS